MARVLHLLEQVPDYQSETAVSQLTRDGSARILKIGRGGDFANPMLAVLKLRNEVGDCDLIHCWGEMALSIAAIMTAKRLIYSPNRFPTRRNLKWIRAVMSVRDVQIICPTDSMRRAFVERGVPIERCHMIRPGVEFSKIKRKRDNDLRTKLGFGKDDYVLLAIGESLRGANHHLTILASTVLRVFHPKYRLLLWGRGALAESEKRFGSLMLNLKHIEVATDFLGPDVPFENLLPACDAGLLTPNEPIPTLPIAICMAGAMPIISTVTPTVAELLEDRHTCLMAKKETSRWIARRVLDLQDDPQLLWKIGDTAHTEAYEFFSMTRFVNQYRAVHEQVANGKKVEVPEQPPGPGVRFAGLK